MGENFTEFRFFASSTDGWNFKAALGRVGAGISK